MTLFLFSCNKHHSGSLDNTMTAQVGTTSFSAKGSAVNVQISTSTQDDTKTQLTITGEYGNTVLTVVVFDYKNTTGTYNFTDSDALVAYDSSSGSGGDVFTTSNIVITSVSDSRVEGTFVGTGQTGTTITNGSFSVEK